MESRHGHLGRTCALGAVLILAVGLRVTGLANESPWGDEAVTLTPLAAPSFAEFYAESANISPMYPVYYVFEYLWARCFGAEAHTIRGLSVLFGVLTIPVVWMTGRRLFGDRAALVAALFVALSPMHIRFSQEIRFYALSWFLVAVSSYCFVRLWHTPRSRRWRLFYAATSFMLLFTHPLNALVLPAHALALLLDSERRRYVSGWVLFHAPLFLAFGVWSVFALEGFDESRAWIASRLLQECGTALSWYAGTGAFVARIHVPGMVETAMKLGIVAGAAVAAGWTFWKGARGNAAARFVALWAVLPPVLMLIVSWMVIPCFVARYAGYASLGVALMFGALFHDAPTGRGRKALALLLACLFAGQALLLHLSRPLRTDWRAAAAAIQVASPSPRVFVNNAPAQFAFAYALGNSRVMPLLMKDAPSLTRYLTEVDAPAVVCIDPEANDLGPDVSAALETLGRSYRVEQFPGRTKPLSLYFVSPPAHHAAQ